MPLCSCPYVFDGGRLATYKKRWQRRKKCCQSAARPVHCPRNWRGSFWPIGWTPRYAAPGNRLRIRSVAYVGAAPVFLPAYRRHVLRKIKAAQRERDFGNNGNGCKHEHVTRTPQITPVPPLISIRALAVYGVTHTPSSLHRNWSNARDLRSRCCMSRSRI